MSFRGRPRHKQPIHRHPFPFPQNHKQHTLKTRSCSGGTQTRPSGRLAGGRPRRRHRDGGRHRHAPSRPEQPSGSCCHPPWCGRACRQSQRGRPGRRGWSRGQRSVCANGDASGSGWCARWWSAWGGAGCGAEPRRERGGQRTSSPARG